MVRDKGWSCFWKMQRIGRRNRISHSKGRKARRCVVDIYNASQNAYTSLVPTLLSSPHQLVWILCYTCTYTHWEKQMFIKNHVQAHSMKGWRLTLESFSEIHRVVLELGSSNSETPTHPFPANCSTFAFCASLSKRKRYGGMGSS